MLKKFSFAVALSLCALVGCLPAGENIVVITGSIEGYDKLADKKCELLIVEMDSEKDIYQVSVSKVFRIDYTVAPHFRKYKVRVECAGADRYESEVVPFGDRPKTEIELGSIIFGKINGSATIR